MATGGSVNKLSMMIQLSQLFVLIMAANDSSNELCMKIRALYSECRSLCS